MVEVVNMRTCYPPFGSLEGDVRIDRESKWGNPFHISRQRGRDEVCDLYELYIRRRMLVGELSIDELLTAKRLGCWCKPKRCHGDFLKKLIEDVKYGFATTH